MQRATEAPEAPHCASESTVLALHIEEDGHICWVLEVYLLGI